MKSFQLIGVIFSVFAMGMLGACEGDTGPAGATGPAGPAGPEGPPGPVSIAAFASINLGGGPGGACVAPGGPPPCVYYFGGDSVTNVTVTQLTGVGDYEVRFFGSWCCFASGESHRYQMTVLASTQEGDGQYIAAPLQATSGGVRVPDGTTGIATEIFTRINVWNSSDLTPADADFSVAIFR